MNNGDDEHDGRNDPDHAPWWVVIGIALEVGYFSLEVVRVLGGI